MRAGSGQGLQEVGQCAASLLGPLAGARPWLDLWADVLCLLL